MFLVVTIQAFCGGLSDVRMTILTLQLFLSDKDYENAIKYYTEALELNPSNAIYFSNRSLAYLRTECYGYALADATRALEIDKNYIKGYYRRATSNMALGKFKAALKDYETVCSGLKLSQAEQLLIDEHYSTSWLWIFSSLFI